MSDSYIIEVRSQAAGIVVRNPGGFRFFAASSRFTALEGQVFRNAREAERAALRLASGGIASDRRAGPGGPGHPARVTPRASRPWSSTRAA